MRTAVVLSFLTLAISTAPLEAQNRHEGFWLGFGLGGGSNLDAGAGQKAGGAAYLRLGGAPTPQLLIGGEVLGWGRSEGNATVGQANLTGDIAFYPSLNGGLFLKVGLGFASTSFQTTLGNVTTTIRDEGLGTTFGAGYDFKLGRNFYLTPNVDLLVQRISGATGKLLLITLGATWH